MGKSRSTASDLARPRALALPRILPLDATLIDRSNTGSAPLVTLDFPQPLQQRVVNALKADPRTVDLRAQAPHFYALGAKILDLFEDEDIADVLMEVSLRASHLQATPGLTASQTFRKRAAEIADHAHNPKGAMGEGAEFLRGLDEIERQLFKSAHEGAKHVRTWQQDLKKQS